MARFRLSRNPLLYWSAVAVLAAVTALVVSALVGRASAAAARYGTARPVAVVTRPVAPGEVVDGGATEVRHLPAAFVPPGALEAVPDGRTALTALHPGEAVLAARVAPDGLTGAAALLPPGTRGVAVPTTAGGLQPAVGDTVDVLATFDPLLAGGGGEPSFAVAEGAAVVDVNAEAVTVAVDADDAPQVAFAVTQGAVTLALTAPG